MEHNQRPESKDCSLSKENIPLADGFGSGNKKRRRKSNVSSTSSQSFERDQLKGKTRKKDGRSPLIRRHHVRMLKRYSFQKSKPRTPLKQQENIPSADGFGSGNKKPKLQTPFKQQENIPSADSPWSTASNTSFKSDCSKDLFTDFKDEQFSPLKEKPTTSGEAFKNDHSKDDQSSLLPEPRTPLKQQENIPSADSPWSTASNASFKSDCSKDNIIDFKDEQFSPMKKKTRGSRKTLFPNVRPKHR